MKLGKKLYREVEDIRRGQAASTLKRDFAVVVIFVQTNTAEGVKKFCEHVFTIG